ncbi:hypothetical protein SMC26_05085 [Actinomadura fulvescens]|uniref:Uncharacterized protein n=1 Tax=Actinomadura fulvescens TaxID=46160 RepID=A0ABP6CFX6_9ACTN
MTAAMMKRPPVWWPIDVDPEQVVMDVKRWFPGVSAWLGEYTGRWWALVGNRLIEAENPDQLRERIASVASPRWPSPPPFITPGATVRRRDTWLGAAEPPPVPTQRTRRTCSPRRASPLPNMRLSARRGRLRGFLRRLVGGPKSTVQQTTGW